MSAQTIIVVKIGSNTLLDQKREVRPAVIRTLFLAIEEARERGRQILLVTSGAVALGRRAFANDHAPRALCAAVGQAELLSLYQEIANEHNIRIGQILLSRPHFLERAHFLHLQQQMTQLFESGVVPIINENDALVADTAWSFVDNDSLAAILAVSFLAQELILVTHVDGLFTADPQVDPGAELITEVNDVNQQLLRYCSDNVSSGGRGGMLSKLKAARICTNAGVVARIINGLKPETLREGVCGGEPVGTLCRARARTRSVSNRERWIIAAKSSAASIEVDDGAATALRQGKSLLAVGIKKLYGSFADGESVEVVDKNKEGIAFGIVDLAADQLLARPFAEQRGVQVIHTDNMIVF